MYLCCVDLVAIFILLFQIYLLLSCRDYALVTCDQRFLSCMAFNIYKVVRITCYSHSFVFCFAWGESPVASCWWFALSMRRSFIHYYRDNDTNFIPWEKSQCCSVTGESPLGTLFCTTNQFVWLFKISYKTC